MKRQIADQRGRDAEALAAAWLEGQGWEIAAQRVKTKAGEIDLLRVARGLSRLSR